MKQYMLLAPLVAALAIAGTAPAQEIAVLNPGFEDDVLSCAAGYNCDAVGVTGWLIGPGTFVYKPSTVQFPGGVPGGTNVAALGNTSTTGSVLQTLGATVQPNTTYILRLSVGARADYQFTGYIAALLAGNVTLAASNSATPVGGTFVTAAIGYKSGANPPQLGQTLQVLVKSLGTGQVDIDNVSVVALPTAN